MGRLFDDVVGEPECLAYDKNGKVIRVGDVLLLDSFGPEVTYRVIRILPSGSMDVFPSSWGEFVTGRSIPNSPAEVFVQLP